MNIRNEMIESYFGRKSLNSNSGPSCCFVLVFKIEYIVIKKSWELSLKGCIKFVDIASKC